MNSNSEKNKLVMSDVVAKCWNDPDFKSKLLADPKKVLRDAGIEGITDSIHVRVLENTASRKYIVLPPGDKSADYIPELTAFITSKLPLPSGLELGIVQNTEALANVVLPVPPAAYQGKLDASHAQVLAATGYEAINLYTTANAAAEANAAAVSNALAATNVAGAAEALVVIAVVI